MTWPPNWGWTLSQPTKLTKQLIYYYPGMENKNQVELDVHLGNKAYYYMYVLIILEWKLKALHANLVVHVHTLVYLDLETWNL